MESVHHVSAREHKNALGLEIVEEQAEGEVEVVLTRG
jgi:hypothetical protein